MQLSLKSKLTDSLFVKYPSGLSGWKRLEAIAMLCCFVHTVEDLLPVRVQTRSDRGSVNWTFCSARYFGKAQEAVRFPFSANVPGDRR